MIYFFFFGLELPPAATSAPPPPPPPPPPPATCARSRRGFISALTHSSNSAFDPARQVSDWGGEGACEGEGEEVSGKTARGGAKGGREGD
jgi:hypothetical protein